LVEAADRPLPLRGRGSLDSAGVEAGISISSANSHSDPPHLRSKLKEKKRQIVIRASNQSGNNKKSTAANTVHTNNFFIQSFQPNIFLLSLQIMVSITSMKAYFIAPHSISLGVAGT
jgi:hypothetical protein